MALENEIIQFIVQAKFANDLTLWAYGNDRCILCTSRFPVEHKIRKIQEELANCHRYAHFRMCRQCYPVIRNIIKLIR
jgi:hypothetical protein